MKKAEIECRLAEVISKHGPWTAHNIDLGDGVSTLGKKLWQTWRVVFFAGLMRDCLGFDVFPARGLLDRLTGKGRSWKKLRVFDLACLEGLFAIEFARMGHQTVGIEVREQHLIKAEFARQVLGLSDCRLLQGDVRHIPADLKDFDVTLCAGILYHLDFPDVVRFLLDIAARTRGLVIIDSHFAYEHIERSVLPLSAMEEFQFEGITYRGRRIVEHMPHVSAAEKQAVHGWASIDNDVSVWLAEQDVARVMGKAGFALAKRAFPSKTYQQDNPDRPTLVFKRVRQRESA